MTFLLQEHPAPIPTSENQSSLDFYRCLWYSLCAEAKDTATRQKNIDIARCCMRARDVGSLRYPGKGGSRLSCPCQNWAGGGGCSN